MKRTKYKLTNSDMLRRNERTIKRKQLPLITSEGYAETIDGFITLKKRILNEILKIQTASNVKIHCTKSNLKKCP